MKRTAAGCMALLKREPVLFVSAAAAVVTMFFVPPSVNYGAYIDWRVLCLLFCLMASVAGLRQDGLFDRLARGLLAGRREWRLLSLLLTWMPFFCAMLVTNDVALLAFVPFTLFVLARVGRERDGIRLIVLQTMAANLGSMATPVGNPQNLFLYSAYGLSPGAFFGTVLPYAAVSLAGLSLAALWTRGETIEVRFPPASPTAGNKGRWLPYMLFLLCLLSVFRLVPYGITTAAALLGLLAFRRELFRQVDYALLLTFACFFIFAGNLGRIEPVSDWLGGQLEKNGWLTSALASQGISNVPAAVLLSRFTDNWRGLLVGTNIGGLGTPVASLASLISLKLYMRGRNARAGRYLAVFTLSNGIGLAVLCLTAWLLNR